jgi:outer membrane protein TolC
LILTGCGSREPRDLSLARDSSPPTPEEIRIAAAELDHPILKPIEIDDRDGISPDEAAVVAVLSNPALRAIRSRRGIAGAQVIAAGILPNPEILAGVGLPMGERSDSVPVPYGLGLGWEVTSLLGRSARVDAAEAHAGAIDLEVAWQEWQVSQSAKMHVIRLLLLEEEIPAARTIEESRRASLEVARQALDLGEGSGLDLAAAESARFEAAARHLQLEEEREAERSMLQRVLGLPPGSQVPLQHGSMPRMASRPPPAEALDRIEERRLDLLALRKGYESQEAKLRAAVWGGFPRIRLGVLTGRDTNAVETLGFGISVELPFFDRNQGAIAHEEATCDTLFEEYRVRLFEARHQVAQILGQMESLEKRLALEDESLETLRRTVESLADALERGSIAAPAYHDARTNLGLKEIQILRLRRAFHDLSIGLEIATGGVLRPQAARLQGD